MAHAATDHFPACNPVPLKAFPNRNSKDNWPQGPLIKITHHTSYWNYRFFLSVEWQSRTLKVMFSKSSFNLISFHISNRYNFSMLYNMLHNDWYISDLGESHKLRIPFNNATQKLVYINLFTASYSISNILKPAWTVIVYWLRTLRGRQGCPLHSN